MVEVAEIGGVRYYDDSKGTNVGAAATAVLGVAEDKVVLIAGGRDKLGSYAPLADAMKAKGRAAVLIGEAAARIETGCPRVHRPRSPREVDGGSREDEQGASRMPGDAVLLSPACSSFDMFRDYKHRGDEFVSAVKALEGPDEDPLAERAPHARAHAPLDASPNALRARGPMDPALAATVVGLIGFGVVMVYSASAATATNEQHDAQFFLKRQAAYALASLLVLFGVSRVDYHRPLQAHLSGARGRRGPACRVRRRVRSQRRRRDAVAVDWPRPRSARRDGKARHRRRLALAYSLARRSPRRPSASRRSRSGSCRTCSWPACS